MARRRAERLTGRSKRADAVRACIQRFRGKAYAPGKRDDVLMAAHLLHHLGISVPVLKGCEWKCEASGLRLLKRKGFGSLHEAVDTLGLERIGWGSARLGDLIALPSTCGVGALAVHTGNGTMLAYREGRDEAGIIRISDAIFAWRTT